VVGRLGKSKVISIAAQLTAGACRELNVTVPAFPVNEKRLEDEPGLTKYSRALARLINQIRGRSLKLP
jgi:hypothetical protein